MLAMRLHDSLPAGHIEKRGELCSRTVNLLPISQMFYSLSSFPAPLCLCSPPLSSPPPAALSSSPPLLFLLFSSLHSPRLSPPTPVFSPLSSPLFLLPSIRLPADHSRPQPTTADNNRQQSDSSVCHRRQVLLPADHSRQQSDSSVSACHRRQVPGLGAESVDLAGRIGDGHLGRGCGADQGRAVRAGRDGSAVLWIRRHCPLRSHMRMQPFRIASRARTGDNVTSSVGSMVQAA